MKKLSTILFVLLGLVFFSSCSEVDEDLVYNKQKKFYIKCDVSSITSNSACIDFIVADDYFCDFNIGIAFSGSSESPTFGAWNTRTQKAVPVGNNKYRVNLTGLEPSSPYFCKAYAEKNGHAIMSGNVDYFLTEGVHVSSIKIRGEKTTMTVGETQNLSVTVLPENATNKSVTWSSSNQSVVTVSSTGKVSAVGEGTATIIATAADGSGVKGTFEISVTAPTYLGHEYVDLGLPSGTKWATCNVGANAPEEYGDYFAWGETSPKSSYDWSNLKYCLDSSGDKFSKYVTDSKYGNVDNKTELDREDDAAHVNWGGDWRMPTKAQIDELLEKCKWSWIMQGGHNGYKVVGPNGKSIFLPAAGSCNGSSRYSAGTIGEYWSSSLSTDDSSSAYYLYFFWEGERASRRYRCLGLSVRPVRQ